MFILNGNSTILYISSWYNDHTLRDLWIKNTSWLVFQCIFIYPSLVRVFSIFIKCFFTILPFVL